MASGFLVELLVAVRGGRGTTASRSDVQSAVRLAATASRSTRSFIVWPE